MQHTYVSIMKIFQIYIIMITNQHVHKDSHFINVVISKQYIFLWNIQKFDNVLHVCLHLFLITVTSVPSDLSIIKRILCLEIFLIVESFFQHLLEFISFNCFIHDYHLFINNIYTQSLLCFPCKNARLSLSQNQ